MRKVAAAYFGFIGVFLATGLMVEATAGNTHHHCTTEASISELWHQQVALPSDLEAGWQHQLDDLHW